MKKSKKNLMAIALASVLGVSSLTGCTGVEAEEESQAVEAATEESSNEEEETQTVEEVVETKIFEPYTHVYYVRVDNEINTNSVTGGQVEVPEGYEILDIEPWTERVLEGSRSPGFDVWYINNKTVEATLVYNAPIGVYDYSEPGVVIELTNEEEGPTKTLIP